MDEGLLQDLTVAQLKEKLRERNKKISGSKSVLISRLLDDDDEEWEESAPKRTKLNSSSSVKARKPLTYTKSKSADDDRHIVEVAKAAVQCLKTITQFTPPFSSEGKTELTEIFSSLA